MYNRKSVKWDWIRTRSIISSRRRSRTWTDCFLTPIFYFLLHTILNPVFAYYGIMLM